MSSKTHDAAIKTASKLLNVTPDRLDTDLINFLNHNNTDLQLIARAGSGKTTAITLKIAHLINDLNINPSTIMVLTFNNSAARDLETRLASFGVSQTVKVRTFHALAQRIIRTHFGYSRQIAFDYEGEIGQRCSELLQEAIDETLVDRFYHWCSGRIKIPYKKNKVYVEDISNSALISAIGFLRARGYGMHKKFKDAWDIGGPITATAMKIIYNYEHKLKQNYLLDGPAVLQAASWTLERENKLGVFKDSDAHDLSFIFIDEFQDFSEPYKRLVTAIRNINAMTITQVVGDDWQAINGFAGSDLSHFNEPENFLEDPEVMCLLKNRRSGSKIVDWGNQVMACAPNHAIPVPENGAGNIHHHRHTAYSDLTVFCNHLIKQIDPNLSSVALIARKWLVGELPLTKIHKKLNDIAKLNNLDVCIHATTAHGSKGLEWDQVILLDDGSFPLKHPSRPIMEFLVPEEEWYQEEMCLKYVAGTRAKKTLTIIDCSK